MSNLVLYKNPWSISTLFDREFSDLLDGFWNNNLSSTFNPNIEVTENEREYKLVVEAPGINKKDVHVEADNGIIRLWGEKKAGKKEKKENCTYSERSYGRFERSFRLPESVEADNINAKYTDGILELTIPKTEKAKEKAIEVKIE